MSIIKDSLNSNKLHSLEEVSSYEHKEVAKNSPLKSLGSIVQLKSNKEFKGIFEQFHEVFSAMIRGDFTKRISLSNRKNLFTYFGAAINSVIEELEVNVVKTHYLESSLEFISDMAFLTNKDGKILFINSEVVSFLNLEKQKIINIPIQQLIEFGANSQFRLASEQFTESIIKFNSFTSKVLVREKKLYDVMGEHDGYLYIAKRMLTGAYKIKNLNNRYIISKDGN